MQERHSLSDRGRCRRLARLKLLEEPVRIVHLAATVGEVRHVAQDARLRLRLHGEVDRLGVEEVGDAPARPVRTAVLVHHHAVLLPEALLVRREEIPLRPLVQRPMLEEPVVPALRRLDLPALGEVLELVLLQMNVLRRLLQIKYLA